MARRLSVCWAAPLAFFSFSLYPASSTSSFRIFSSNAVVRSSSLWLASPNDGAGAFAFLAPKMRRMLFLVCWSLWLFGVYCGRNCCSSQWCRREQAGPARFLTLCHVARCGTGASWTCAAEIFLPVASVLPLARDTKLASIRGRAAIQGYRCARPLKARAREGCLHRSQCSEAACSLLLSLIHI